MVLGLLWCSTAISKDLTGNILLCPKKDDPIFTRYFEFINPTEVKRYTISLGYLETIFNYEVTHNKIILFGKATFGTEKGDYYIDRKTLIVHPRQTAKCQLTEANTNVEKEIKSILDKINKL